jgi:hypothetical protein
MDATYTSKSSGRWAAAWQQLSRAPGPLLWTGLGLLLLALPTALLMQWDPRSFNGVSVWMKPWKFQVSIGTYLLTLALFMAWLPAERQRGRAGTTLVWMAVSCGIFEVAYISWQGAWGMASHFNVGTPGYAFMYSLMGVGAVLLTTASLILAVLIARCPDYRASAPLKLAIVLGLLLTWLLGTGFGAYLSAQPTGHWVGGVASDAAGLPVVGWSRSGGDLRVAHFFGIHAMHFIPAFAAGLLALGMRHKAAIFLTCGFAVSLCILTVFTFVQARAGLPLVGDRMNAGLISFASLEDPERDPCVAQLVASCMLVES